MLEAIRRNTRSVFVYIIFGVLIAVFILTFGPQSGQRAHVGKSTGCGTDEVFAARVSGHEISENSWRYGILFMTGGNGATGERARRDQIRERVMDALIVREVLAQTAEEMGFRLSDDEVREKLVHGEMYILGHKVDARGRSYVQNEGEERYQFKASALDNYAKYLGLGSVDRFIAEQRRELLAQKMRELVTASIRVSPEEVLHKYESDNNKVDVEYVAFQPAMYGDDVELTPADIEAYATAHDADLKKQYDAQKERFTKREKEVRIRDIFIKKPVAAPPPAPTGSAASSAPAPVDPGKAKAQAEAVLARVKKGEDFATVAKAVSEDLRTAKKGGDTGWRKPAGLRLGEEVKTAVEKMKDKGSISDVIETPEGFYIVQLVDAREGNLTYDSVKMDLAETALKEERTTALARADAEKALAAAKVGTTLDRQFPADADKPIPGIPTKPRPRLQQATDIGRVSTYIPGIGKSPELMTMLFDELKPGDLAPTVVAVDKNLYVVRLLKHTEPDMTKFEADKVKIAAEMNEAKAAEVISLWEADRCREAAEKKEVSWDTQFTEYGDAQAGAGADTDGAGAANLPNSQKKQKSPPYRPCMTFLLGDGPTLAGGSSIQLQ